MDGNSTEYQGMLEDELTQASNDFKVEKLDT